MTAFDLSAYLERVGQAHVALSVAGLSGLQAAQLRSVPFENIDVLLGRTPAVDLPAIFDKTVRQARGGYCFELNGLFGAALTALGFPVRRSLARVRLGQPEGGQRSHLALQVEIGGRRYLADAGFGGPGPLVPLAIDTPAEQDAPNGTYRIVDDPVSGEKVLERRTETGWFALYGFDDAWVGDMDIGAANFVCANWHESPFGTHLMLSGYDGTTRIGVFDRSVTVEAAGETRRRDLADVADLTELLAGRLGLSLDRRLAERIWRRLDGAAATRSGRSRTV